VRCLDPSSYPAPKDTQGQLTSQLELPFMMKMPKTFSRICIIHKRIVIIKLKVTIGIQREHPTSKFYKLHLVELVEGKKTKENKEMDKLGCICFHT
jgi:hypothetical protein